MPAPRAAYARPRFLVFSQLRKDENMIKGEIRGAWCGNQIVIGTDTLRRWAAGRVKRWRLLLPRKSTFTAFSQLRNHGKCRQQDEKNPGGPARWIDRTDQVNRSGSFLEVKLRSKRVIAGRGVGGTDKLLERGEADVDDFGGDSETLRPRSCVSWAENFKRFHTWRGPTLRL